jgi:hypothetical protein
MSKEKKVKKGCSEFIPNQDRWESGVEQKLKGENPLRLWYVHKIKKC